MKYICIIETKGDTLQDIKEATEAALSDIIVGNMSGEGYDGSGAFFKFTIKEEK